MKSQFETFSAIPLITNKIANETKFNILKDGKVIGTYDRKSSVFKSSRTLTLDSIELRELSSFIDYIVAAVKPK